LGNFRKRFQIQNPAKQIGIQIRIPKQKNRRKRKRIETGKKIEGRSLPG
jgi:hypothetical protein